MAERDLAVLLASMAPFVRHEAVVLVGTDLPLPALAVIEEDEGTTRVVTRAIADEHGLPYDFVASWITLSVESDLAAVGLTAAVSTALARSGIACNVLAGLRHDHLLVPADRCAEALAVLAGLSAVGS